MLKEIEDLSEELQEYIDDLKGEVDDAVDEAREIVKAKDGNIYRLAEINIALKRVVYSQAKDLGNK